MPNYYYTDTNGSKQGLYTEQQLQRLIVRGRVTPTTPVETDAGFKGIAGQIPGLNFTASSPFAQTLPPTSSPSVQQETYPLPQSAPSATANPFSAPSAHVANHAMPQYQYQSAPIVDQVIPQNISTSVADEHGGSSWQVTIIGAVLILVVGGIGWQLISATSNSAGQTKADKPEIVAEAQNTPIVDAPKPDNNRSPVVNENRPAVADEKRVATTSASNTDRHSLWLANQAVLNGYLQEALTAISKDIMLTSEQEWISILAKFNVVDLDSCGCSDEFKTAYKELVKSLTEYSLSRNVLANAKRRGDSANYIAYSEEDLNRKKQSFGSAVMKYQNAYNQEVTRKSGGNPEQALINKFLEKHGNDLKKVDAAGKTLLHKAVSDMEPLVVVKHLVSQGLDVNAKARDGSTPLLAAITKQNVDVVEFLASNGADLNVRIDTLIPLGAAMQLNNIEMARILISNGANVNAVIDTKEGTTLLHAATFLGNLEIAKLLVTNGANVNAKMKNDFSTLHIAATKGHLEIVKLLVANGANVNARTTPNGRTPLGCATSERKTAVASYLRSVGGR